MESEFDKALRIACELLPQAQADALRLAVKAKTDNFTAVLERTWASQRDLAASRDAALAALAESEARRAESERTIKEMREGLHADCPHKPARLAAERSLAAAVEVLREGVALWDYSGNDFHDRRARWLRSAVSVLGGGR